MVSGLIADVPVSIPGLNSVTESLLLVDKSVDNGNLEVNTNLTFNIYDIPVFILLYIHIT